MSKEIWTKDQINQLIQEINNGNKDALKQLVSNYADVIHFQAALYNSEKEAVSKCFQDACNAAARNIKDFDTENPEKWFEKIAADTAIASATVVMETADSAYDSSDEYIDEKCSLPDDPKTLRSGILNAMKGVTAAERTAFALRFYEHMNNSQAAQKLQVDTNQIEALLTNAKKAMVDNGLSVTAIISAMNKLNPIKEDKETVIPPIVTPVKGAAVTRKTPGIKALLFALAGVVVIAALLILVPGKNKSDGNQSTGNNTAIQNTGNGNSTGNPSNNDSSTSAENNNGGHTSDFTGLNVEEEVVEVIGENSNGNDTSADSGNSGSSSTGSTDNQQSASESDSGSQSGTTPAESPDTSSQEGSNSGSSTEADDGLAEDEVDLGDGYVTGGF